MLIINRSIGHKWRSNKVRKIERWYAKSCCANNWSAVLFYQTLNENTRTQIISSTSTLRRRFLGTSASSSLPADAPLLPIFCAFSSVRAFCSWVIYLSFAAIEVWFASKLLLARVSNRLYFDTKSSTGSGSDDMIYNHGIAKSAVSEQLMSCT